MQGKTGDVHIQRVIPVGKEDRAGRIKPCLGVIIFSLVYRVAFPVLFFYSTGRKTRKWLGGMNTSLYNLMPHHYDQIKSLDNPKI